jgi:hypothetical protein
VFVGVSAIRGLLEGVAGRGRLPEFMEITT